MSNSSLPSVTGLDRSAPLGLTARTEHVLKQRAFDLVAALLGAPAQVPGSLPDAAHVWIVQGMVLDFLALHLPGPGAEVLSQELRFGDDLALGDRIAIEGRIAARPTPETATIAVRVASPRGMVAEGCVVVRLPEQPVSMRPEERPEILLARRRHLDRLMTKAATLPPLTTAVAWPCDRDSLQAALEATCGGSLRPILIGPGATIRALAGEIGAELDGCELVEVANPLAAAAEAVRFCREGRASALMKGSLHTDELMAAVVAHECGLRGPGRMSHVFVMDVPSYHKPLFITDAALNITPDLGEKADIIRNAVLLAHALGIALPKVAILSTVETVTPKIPSTLDAAALCKMADRGQITGALLDGPLAFDNAVSVAAARIKGIVSPVAGDADILLVPNIEAGNMLAKQLRYLGNADGAGIVLGARVPVILTSRADSVTARLASIALAQLLVSHAADS